MPNSQDSMRSFWKEEQGTTATEYGLIAMLVSVGLIAALWMLSDALAEIYEVDAAAVNDAVGGTE